nr:retrovirus-related Pol polyprotein from transposon TNT 1-94 [Tanacetum cinerariifolium]GEX96207.1 retrovirus-related Pol polyprotein from transposon TNT 1-94 [Tanacetum cinerariifolium]
MLQRMRIKLFTSKENTLFSPHKRQRHRLSENQSCIADGEEDEDILFMAFEEDVGSMGTENMHDASKDTWLYFLFHKSEALECCKKFKAFIKIQSGDSLKVLGSDSKEFFSLEFNDFGEAYGIKSDLTAPYTTKQNGITDGKNRTIVEIARCMMKAKKLS